jgi:hypothetical protein
MFRYDQFGRGGQSAISTGAILSMQVAGLLAPF